MKKTLKFPNDQGWEAVYLAGVAVNSLIWGCKRETAEFLNSALGH